MCPTSLSADMAKELSRLKVPHAWVTVEGGGHSLGGGGKVVARPQCQSPGLHSQTSQNREISASDTTSAL